MRDSRGPRADRRAGTHTRASPGRLAPGNGGCSTAARTPYSSLAAAQRRPQQANRKRASCGRMHPRRGPRQLTRHCPARLRRLVLPPSAGQPRLRRGRSLDAAQASRRVARRQRPAAGTRWSPAGRRQVGERRHRGIAIDRLRWRRPGATPRTRRETGRAVAPWPGRGSCAAAGSGRRQVVARTRRRPPRMNPAATQRRHDPPPRRHVRPAQDRGRPRTRRCPPRPRLPARTDPALASRAALPAAIGFAACIRRRAGRVSVGRRPRTIALSARSRAAG